VTLTLTDRSIVSQVAGKIAAELVGLDTEPVTPHSFQTWHKVVNDTILRVLEDSAVPPTAESSTPPAPTGTGTTAAPGPPPESSVVEQGAPSPPSNDLRCPRCGGEVWDNRAKKRSGKFKAKSPDIACKDKDNCRMAAYVNEDGTLNIWEN
jgi:hypothetical protein